MGSSLIKKPVRIAVFYDGEYFYRAGKYHRHIHKAQSWISFHGFHEFIQDLVSKIERYPAPLCRVAESHYFKGRLPADEAAKLGMLKVDRIAEDIMMDAGVNTHYLPMYPGRPEKGIDVWFALEAYESVVHKGFEIVVLVTGDGDMLPLVRKLHARGTKTILIYWDETYNTVDSNGNTVSESISASRGLVDEVAVSVDMGAYIDNPNNANSNFVKGLFWSSRQPNPMMSTNDINGTDENKPTAETIVTPST
jgi:uncharacterized LabA/DUF88 family protein